jgi:Zn finger protein HypA/HybF involved in hydrogenase expression
MGLQRCPKCGSEAFSWSVDKELSQFTLWRCAQCSYGAEEDESKERACESCGGGDVWLRDGDREYRFCIGCGRIAAT